MGYTWGKIGFLAGLCHPPGGGLYRGPVVTTVPRDGAVEQSRAVCAEPGKALPVAPAPVEFYCCQGWLFWEWRLVVNHRLNLAFPPR